MKHKNKKFIFPLPSFLFFIAVFALYPDGIGALTVFSACLHELGHLISAKICSVKVETMTVYPFGADIKLSSSLRSYKTELIIALSGPICNLAAALIGRLSSMSEEFVICNLVLASVNLLPIRGLDGGTVLSSLLHLWLFPDVCRRIVNAVSFLCLFLAYTVSVYLLFPVGGDPSLFIIVCSLFVSIYLKKQNA